MEYNPYAVTYSAIARDVNGLIEEERRITADLDWYANLPASALKFELRSLLQTEEARSRGLADIEDEITKLKGQFNDTSSARRTLLNPANWFSGAQVAIRLAQKRFQQNIHERLNARQSTVNELKDLRHKIEEAKQVVERHTSFDLRRRQSELLRIRKKLTTDRSKLQLVAGQKKRVDDILAPLLRELQNLDSRKRQAESKLTLANRLDQQLSSANNSYDRAMIHQECEREFNIGSPRKIIAEKEREIRQVDSDCGKTKRRLEEVARKAARIIETIVVDGNNLCYEGRTFIGLSAIEALMPLLSQDHQIIVVFDAAIRRMLNSNDSQIQQFLAEYANVHVVASRQYADETILDLASGNENAYVLSNDRFGDFNEKPVVREGRIIRHEIVGGKVLVHDLSLVCNY